jgi:hypothetical protein
MPAEGRLKAHKAFQLSRPAIGKFFYFPVLLPGRHADASPELVNIE